MKFLQVRLTLTLTLTLTRVKAQALTLILPGGAAAEPQAVGPVIVLRPPADDMK